MITVTFVVEIAICCALYYARVKKTKESVHPELIFLMMYCFVTSGYYFAKTSTGDFGGRFFAPEMVQRASAICVAGFASYLITYLVKTNIIRRALPIWEANVSSSILYRNYVIAAIFSIGILLIYVYLSFASGAMLVARGANQFSKSKATDLVLNSRMFACLGILVCTQLSLVLYGKLSGLAISLVVIACIVDFVMGGRMTSFFTIFGVMYIYDTFKPVRLSYLLVTTLCGLVINYIITTIRIMGPRIDMFSNISSISYSFADLFRRFLLTLSATEIDTLIVGLYGDTGKLYYGYTYLGSLFNALFPKTVWGFYVLEPLNVTFRNRFYADLTSMGYDFTLVSESIMNFGCWGPAVIMIFVALLLCSVGRKTAIQDVFLPLKTMIISRTLFALRSDSNSFLKSVLYLSLFYILMLLISGVTSIKKAKSTQSARNCPNTTGRPKMWI